ncbi:hypothetical protein H5410_057525 [Solanum commersonii]|uniref:Uncharacterized protein n=1 Tax=Solanum commersonii TaxID=4109 RepID=A0A9J5WQB1_SOLCO|nr:hypothetical protein H5410_057525 [Solanum commersonii]
MEHNVMNYWILEKIRRNDKKGGVLKENQADVNLKNSEEDTSKVEIVQEEQKNSDEEDTSKIEIIQEEQKNSDEEQTSAEKLGEIKRKIRSKKKNKVPKKRSKVMFKPAISSIKRGRRKKHNDGQQRTKIVEHVEPSESVELVEVGQSQQIVVAENSTNISEGNGTRKNGDNMADNTEKRVENTHQKEKSDDNEKISSTNLHRELINQEPVELNCEHVGNQIARQPITNLEDNNTYIEETDYDESSNMEGEGTHMQKDGAQTKNENITETRGRSKERKKANKKQRCD